MNSSLRPLAVVTGASGGIGAIYAERLAQRGYDLVLVARNETRLGQVAARIRAAGASVETIRADVGNLDDLVKLEARLRDDESISMLVNNAGITSEGQMATARIEPIAAMLAVNVVALTRLTTAIVPRLVRQKRGAVINLGSVTALMAEAFEPGYSASKAYVLAFTQSVAAQVEPAGVRVQAVLPGVTRTEIWSDATLAAMPPAMIMDAGDMVDAALAGFDAGEVVTIPALPDLRDWEAYEAARVHLRPNLSRAQPAARYRATADA